MVLTGVSLKIELGEGKELFCLAPAGADGMKDWGGSLASESCAFRG